MGRPRRRLTIDGGRPQRKHASYGLGPIATSANSRPSSWWGRICPVGIGRYRRAACWYVPHRREAVDLALTRIPDVGQHGGLIGEGDAAEIVDDAVRAADAAVGIGVSAEMGE